MTELRETVSLSLYGAHKRVLQIWSDQTGLNVSALVRFLIEEHSNHRFSKNGWGWELLPPKHEREQSK